MASLVATLAMSLGVTALTPGAAMATPRPHHTGYYPPEPPVLVVNKGTVKAGKVVRATGRKFAKRERVKVTIVFTPKGNHHRKIVRTIWVRADKHGKFSINTKMSFAGTATIRAKGQKSGQSSTATVKILKAGHGGGWWDVHQVAFTGNGGTGTPALSSTPASSPVGGTGMALAGLGVMALAGSAIVTRQSVRRRRKVGAAA
jgi:hypothetical protein